MATYYVDLPSDYLHLLNCICIYNVKKTYKCYNKGDTWRAAATRLTADAYSQILDNFWNQPTYKKPYFYLHNINTNNVIPTNPYNSEDRIGNDLPSLNPLKGKDPIFIGEANEPNSLEFDCPITLFGCDGDSNQAHKQLPFYVVKESGKAYQVLPGMIFKLAGRSAYTMYDPNDIEYPWIFNEDTEEGKESLIRQYQEESLVLDAKNNPIITNNNSTLFSSIESTEEGINISNIERTAQVRYGNPSKVRMEIRYGTDNSVFTLDQVEGGKGGKIYIDYLKVPQHIRLTQAELDRTEDTSQVLEFPDYVCQEILNELVNIIMENIGDPHLQTHPVVSQSIANPTQAQAPVAAGQTA